MHIPYQQKKVEDTGTSSARNTYFGNIYMYAAFKK